MNLRDIAATIIGMAALTVMAMGQSPAPLMQSTFEDNAGTWTSDGNGGTVSITHTPALVKSGSGALKYDYTIEKGTLSVLSLPIVDGALGKAKSIRFWIHADHAAAFLITLQEKDEGRYNTMFYVPANQWQEIVLVPDDFALGEDKDDPKDPDGRLDLPKVARISILDTGVYAAQSGDANLAAAFNVQDGPHSMEIDDWTVSTSPVAAPPASSPGAKDRALDDLSRPQLAWMPVGGMKIERSAGKPLSGPALQASYHQAPTAMLGLIHRIPRGTLAGMDQIGFTVACTHASKIMVQVEQTGGGKYNTLIDVPGESMLKEFLLPLADFKLADDSGDRQGHLDASKINQLIVIDASGPLSQSDQDNTLWLNRLRAIPK